MNEVNVLFRKYMFVILLHCFLTEWIISFTNFRLKLYAINSWIFLRRFTWILNELIPSTSHFTANISLVFLQESFPICHISNSARLWIFSTFSNTIFRAPIDKLKYSLSTEPHYHIIGAFDTDLNPVVEVKAHCSWQIFWYTRVHARSSEHQPLTWTLILLIPDRVYQALNRIQRNLDTITCLVKHGQFPIALARHSKWR